MSMRRYFHSLAKQSLNPGPANMPMMHCIVGLRGRPFRTGQAISRASLSEVRVAPPQREDLCQAQMGSKGAPLKGTQRIAQT